MSSAPHIARVALAAGLPARYLYWTGRSGRRYVFTRMHAEEAAELEDGIAIAVANGCIEWIGSVEDLARRSGAAAAQASVYVHFLAQSSAERRSVIWDLRPGDAEHPLALAA